MFPVEHDIYDLWSIPVELVCLDRQPRMGSLAWIASSAMPELGFLAVSPAFTQRPNSLSERRRPRKEAGWRRRGWQCMT